MYDLDRQRQLEAQRAVWALQPEWFIDPTLGDDLNDGATTGTALATWAELERRISGLPLRQAVTIWLMGSLPEFCRMRFVVDANFAASGDRVVVRSHPSSWTTVFASDAAGISGVLAKDKVTNQPLVLVDTNTAGLEWSNLLNRRVRIVGGARDGAIGYAWRRVAAVTAEFSEFAIVNPDTWRGLGIVAGLGSLVTPAVGDAYVVEEVPGVWGVDFTLAKTNGAFPNRVVGAIDGVHIGRGAPTEVDVTHVVDTEQLNTLFAVTNSPISGSWLYGRRLALANCWQYRTPGGSINMSAALVCAGGARASSGFFLGRQVNEMVISDDYLMCGGAFCAPYSQGIRITSAAVFDSTTDGFRIHKSDSDAMSLQLNGTQSLWGARNAQFGLRVGGGRVVTYESTVPTVTGTLGDISLAGAVTTWAAVPAVDLALFAAVVKRDP